MAGAAVEFSGAIGKLGRPVLQCGCAVVQFILAVYGFFFAIGKLLCAVVKVSGTVFEFAGALGQLGCSVIEGGGTIGNFPGAVGEFS